MDMDGTLLGRSQVAVSFGNMKAVQKAIEMGIRMVVESETLQPDGLSEVKRCIDYLKTLDA